MNKAIVVQNLSKKFKIPKIKKENFREHFFSLFEKNEYFYLNVLKNLSFEVKEGEFFGIIGRNGSGKSTLLKILAGIYYADVGDVLIKGKITPFLELGVGFNGELSAMENVFLNASVLGMSEKSIRKKYSEIVEFAELKPFMSQKLKNFSSGMQVRLAFSIAIQSDADIYFMDEVLAVGDIDFQAKCFEKFKELKSIGKTIVFVSHDLSGMRKFADRVLYLEEGKIKSLGSPDDVLEEYVSDHSFFVKKNSDEKFPTNSVEFLSFDLSLKNQILKCSSDKTFSLSITCESKINYANPVLGFIIHNQEGIEVFATNSNISSNTVSPLKVGKNVYTINFKNLNLLSGQYFLTIAISDKHCFKDFAWRDKAVSFVVKNQFSGFGVCNIEHEFK